MFHADSLVSAHPNTQPTVPLRLQAERLMIEYTDRHNMPKRTAFWDQTLASVQSLVNAPLNSSPACYADRHSSVIAAKDAPLVPAHLRDSVCLSHPDSTRAYRSYGCLHIGVHKWLLHHSNIIPVFEYVGSKRMPPRVAARGLAIPALTVPSFIVF